MDPLTISTSIFGLLKATAQVVQYLTPYVAAARDTPKIVIEVHSEVVYSRTILLGLQGLTKNLASIPVKRAALIDVDQLIAVFTNGVLLFSELEASLPSLPPTEPASPRMPLQTRLQWASKESAFVALLARLQSFKVTLSSILIILQSDSDHRAEVQQQELLENVAALLETNQTLSRRLMNLEDAFEVGTVVSKLQNRDFSTDSHTNSRSKRQQLNEPNEDGISQPPTPPESTELSSFDFENDLETSRPYRRAQRDTMDFSFQSSIPYTNAWSQFSGLTLSKVSVISAIALPLYPDEIENAQHYDLSPEQPTLAAESTSYTPRPRPLYQSFLRIEVELSQIPGFPTIFAKQRTINEKDDLLTFLWCVFREGIPLLMLLAKVQGVQDVSHYIQLDSLKSREHKIPKVATFIFIKACKDDLGFEFDECFTINDLFGDDSIGFVKVVRVITRLLDILSSDGDMALAAIEPEPDRQMTELPPRDALVEGFLDDERSYVANLEKLLELKKIVETDATLYTDLLYSFLGLLNPIVDTQMRFLLAIEATAYQPLDRKTWAVPFTTWSKSSYLYAKFIAIEKRVKEYIRTVLIEWKSQRIEDTKLKIALTESLRLLYLPSQHLPKYSDFLQELLRQSDETQKEDILNGAQAVQDVLRTINAAIRDQELCEELENLLLRVQDWKDLDVHRFGKLLLFDDLDVATNKSDAQRKHRVYVFERVLLFFGGGSPSRNFARSLIFRRTKSSDTERTSSIKLTGIIPTSEIKDFLSVSKPGAYVYQVFWRGHSGINKTTIKFTTENKMKTWYQAIESQRKERAYPNSDNFIWTEDIGPMMNPYADYPDEDDSGEENMESRPGSLVGISSYPSPVADYPEFPQPRPQAQVEVTAPSVRLPLPRSPTLAPPRLGLKPLLKDSFDGNQF